MNLHMEKSHQIFLKNGGGNSSASVLLLDTYLVLSSLLHVDIRSYASLQPTEKGRSAVNLNESVLLPKIDDTILNIIPTSSTEQACGKNWPRKRIEKGHILPFLKELLMNWRNITAENKEQYQYPGWHASHSSNVLYYAPNITTLPHDNESDKHFIWSDIQLSKKYEQEHTGSDHW